ncbi:sulfurtransferase [Roseovarius aestuariivivens]|uniref:sulfurtransferase n=1 Tax=Roseovarius aestuariivivens TaxID=1888910 RepID=UPI00108157E6|nr:sulfurtransferase [Roseovarius aestuariivivens]
MRTLPRLLAAPVIALALALPLPGLAGSGPLDTAVSADAVGEKKQTKSGLYITAAEAGGILAAREDVLLIDLRTPEETMLVGHPVAADANIPFKLIDSAYRLNPEKGSYEMVANPGFVGTVKEFLESTDPAAVVVMCRSGGRSAAAVDALVAAGVTVPLYSMVDGFEGDKTDAGRRDLNGWKNAGLNWTDKIPEGFLKGVE